jgi:F0F1-type ATP synthase assembly protein I
MEKIKKPSAENSETKPETAAMKRQRQLFMASALSMSWQLAIVVLVPIIGGHELDIHLKTSPFLTVVGFGVAALGTYGLLRSVLTQFKLSPTKPKVKQK